jgi:hypothetical protein
MHLGKRAEDQIGLARAAVPGSEQQPLAADIRRCLAGFDADRLDQYESLLACPDAELFDWITGRGAPPPEYDTEVTRLLLAFRYTPRAT